MKAKLNRGASLLGYGLVVGLIAVVALSAVTGTGSQVTVLFDEVGGQMSSVTNSASAGSASEPVASPSPVIRASCNEIAQNDSVTPGYELRTINPGGGEFSALCFFDDGTFGGGGFTAVVAQYEADPVTWNEGRQPDYQPDLINNAGTSFTLTGSDIPSHSSVMFGRIGAPGETDNIDVLNMTYTTTDIATATLISPVTAVNYQIYRDSNFHYGNHDPESGTGSSSVWDNSLSFDETGGIQLTWSFSPFHTSQSSRGYGYDGAGLSSTLQTYAWVVFVR
ncbi:MAG: hypothetical protein Alpg2KO_08740 [Alphaproteobacteria bacterium]